jgi:hypothetical protein
MVSATRTWIPPASAETIQWAAMVERFGYLLLLIVSLATFRGALLAQAPQTVTVRMIDSHSGILIASNHYLVRVNHLQDDHGDWIRKNEDGSGVLTLPAGATDLSIRATYGYATDYYLNCDTARDRGSAEHAPKLDHWYAVDKILSDGIVAPNNCVGKKVPDRLQVVAKPGEFVFFVRELKPLENFSE